MGSCFWASSLAPRTEVREVTMVREGGRKGEEKEKAGRNTERSRRREREKESKRESKRLRRPKYLNCMGKSLWGKSSI